MKTELPDIIRILLTALSSLSIVYAVSRLSELFGKDSRFEFQEDPDDDFPEESKQRMQAEAEAEKKPSRRSSLKSPMTFSTGAAKQVSSAKENDLTEIEGIGPKSEQILKEAGVKTYSVLADMSSDQIKELLTNQDKRFSLYEVGTWPKQAQLAAAGDWERLDKLKAKIHSGRM